VAADVAAYFPKLRDKVNDVCASTFPALEPYPEIRSPSTTITYPGSKLSDDRSFRILQLQPGIVDNAVFFTLIPAILSDDGPRTTYEAISYA
jgi:hypothetical protein